MTQLGISAGGTRAACTSPAFSEDQYFEMRARLDRMGSDELARFRSAPENQAILRQFDDFVRRQTLPYMLALVVFLVVSVTAALLLVL